MSSCEHPIDRGPDRRPGRAAWVDHVEVVDAVELDEPALPACALGVPAGMLIGTSSSDTPCTRACGTPTTAGGPDPPPRTRSRRRSAPRQGTLAPRRAPALSRRSLEIRDSAEPTAASAPPDEASRERGGPGRVTERDDALQPRDAVETLPVLPRRRRAWAGTCPARGAGTPRSRSRNRRSSARRRAPRSCSAVLRTPNPPCSRPPRLGPAIRRTPEIEHLARIVAVAERLDGPPSASAHADGSSSNAVSGSGCLMLLTT